MHAGGNGLVAANGFRAAAQDAGVAGFQAQAGRIGGHIRASLVDDANHAQRHAHLAQLDAGRAVSKFAHFAHRVGQGGNLAQAFGHLRHASGRQRQPVEHGRLQPGVTGGGQVGLVGGHQRVGLARQGVGDGVQGAVFLLGVGFGQFAAGGAGSAAQRLHVGVNVHRMSFAMPMGRLGAASGRNEKRPAIKASQKG